MELVPTKVLNVRGLVVKEGEVQWVNVTSSSAYIHHAEADLSLSADGAIIGSCAVTEEGYGALARRRELRTRHLRETAGGMLDADRLSLNLDSVWADAGDSVDVPLRIHARISSSSYGQANGGYLYVNPNIVDRQFSTPFLLAARRFPVDMTYPRMLSDDIRWTIPEGYEVREAPIDNEARVGNGDALFTRSIRREGRTVRVLKTLNVNRVEFPPKMYPDLRQFFARVADLDAQPIVLQRKVKK
jgi:hypothetical protein